MEREKSSSCSSDSSGGREGRRYKGTNDIEIKSTDDIEIKSTYDIEIQRH